MVYFGSFQINFLASLFSEKEFDEDEELMDADDDEFDDTDGEF